MSKELKAFWAEEQQRAAYYYKLTGKPLGITGELGEYLVAEALGLELQHARSPGFDATHPDGRRVQIKARMLRDGRMSGRMGAITLAHQFDSVVLILLDSSFNVVGMYEADRPDIEAALTRPGSKARNERGQLAIAQFIAIAKRIT